MREPRTRTASTLILRRFRPPVAVRVTVERGRPVRVAIDRRGMPGGHVEQAAGPWRTSGAWWDGRRRRHGIATSGTPRSATARSAGCSTIGSTDRWFLDGILD